MARSSNSVSPGAVVSCNCRAAAIEKDNPTNLLQSSSRTLQDCGPLLSIKRFTAPAASTTRLRQPQHEASKAEDLPQDLT